MILNEIFVTHIGYFPKAAYHFRNRPNGCTDNILIYCVQGKGWYKVGRQKYDVNAGQYFQITAGKSQVTYAADLENPWSIYWVHYSGKDIDQFNAILAISSKNGPLHVPYNEHGIAIWEEMYSCLEMGYSKGNLNQANMCLHHFLATFLYAKRPVNTIENNLVQESIQFMKTRLTERFTVEDLSCRHSLSVSHFSNLFRRETGTSPLDYFIQLKMQRACQLLYGTSIKIKDIASSLGYEDAFYFSRLFKKMMGLSPEQYRAVK